MRNGNLLKSHVSDICVKQIQVKQGISVVSEKRTEREIDSPLLSSPSNLKSNNSSDPKVGVPLINFKTLPLGLNIENCTQI